MSNKIKTVKYQNGEDVQEFTETTIKLLGGNMGDWKEVVEKPEELKDVKKTAAKPEDK